jgi:hypothetical protein
VIQLWVVIEDWVEASVTTLGCGKEALIDEVSVHIPILDRVSCHLSPILECPWLDHNASIVFITVGPRHWVESRKLVPSRANFKLLLLGLVGDPSLGAAYIGSGVRNTKHVEAHH